MIVLLCLAVAAESYLLGGIDTGILVSKYLLGDDVRTHGSGNAGMTNMLRTYGKLPAALTALGDGFKGVLAVSLAEWIFSLGLMQTGVSPLCGGYLAFVFAILGHMYPVYFGFKGGKGVMVAAGCLLVLNTPVVLVLLVVFGIIVKLTGMVSLGSVILAVLQPLLTLCFGALSHWSLKTLMIAVLCSLIASLMVAAKHRSNLQRIRDGTEYRFGQNNKPKDK